ncbi:MAG TPA: N-acetyltransferase [Candidatus Acidoferrales bacterium]|nr:N-acetyltransferase [Candidatus Acidoferrales bacterium]
MSEKSFCLTNNVREERPGDAGPIARVHRAAFGRDGEAELVERLRERGLIAASVVAEIGSEIVGSAVFSRIEIRLADGETRVAVALAPVAVDPACRRSGFGDRMIRAGLALCADCGYESVFVLGDPSYYGRFGFSTALTATLKSAYRGPHWMALELRNAALSGLHGEVEYPPPFAGVH